MAVVVAAGKLVIRTRLVCREAAIVLLSAQFFTWPSVPVYIAPLSVSCVAVRAVMQLVLSHPFLPSRHFCSVCGRSPSCLAPSTDPPRGCNPPWCATDRGASTVQGSAPAVRTRRCCPADSAGDGQSYRRRSSASSAAWRCSRFG